jgi:outer membrane protein TolC
MAMKWTGLFLLSLPLWAEVHSLTLRDAVKIAVSQNPDVLLSRLEQQKARDGVMIAKDPFYPKIFGGSGLAYTSGFPSTIEGSAPSIFQARATMAIYNRSQSYIVAQARENIRAADLDVQGRQEEIAYRVAAMFLDAQQASQQSEAVVRQLESQERARAAMEQRVKEGRELELEFKRMQLAVMKTRQRQESVQVEVDRAQMELALLLGYPASDRVKPVTEERSGLELPESEEAAVNAALTNSREIKKIESNIAAKGLEMRSYRAQRLPKVDLVAQYALFSKFNNLQNYFNEFQRNNGQIGASITVPIVPSRAATAFADQAEADTQKLRVQANQTRGRIEADARRGWQDVRKAELARDVARADLELAREQLNVYLAQYEEGRLPLSQLEQGRVQESEKWLVYYDAQHVLERARLYILKQSGTLVAALK